MRTWKEKFILYNEIQTDYENIKKLWINNSCWIYLHRSIKKRNVSHGTGRLGGWGGGGGGIMAVEFRSQQQQYKES